MEDLARLGYGSRVEALFAPLADQGFEPARVTRLDRGMPLLATAHGVVRAELAVHLMKSAPGIDTRLAVGDWVALARPEGHDISIVEAILPREGTFVRKDPGAETTAQVLVANVDTVFVVQSLSGGGVNDRRLERELVLVWESGATPVIVLTKADLVDDPEALAAPAREIALGVDIIIESAVTGLGLEQVRERVPYGQTAALLGSSGVGKSTLVNKLIGEDVLETQETRAGDDKGRHTTVTRELFLVPGGGVIVDTPGMRGLALWDSEEGLSVAFADIEQLAENCRFGDCRHAAEPGCAVQQAVEDGELTPRRLESWQRLRSELDALEARRDQRARAEKKRADKVMQREIKRFQRERGR